MEEIKTKIETLTKEKEELVELLKKLDSEYKLGIRNLDRIDGAIFILSEHLKESEKEISKEKVKAEQ